MKKFVAATLCVSFLFPFAVGAVSLPTGLAFGGYVTGATVCTCPPYGLAVAYKPLYLNSSVPIIGTLFYPLIGAILFAYFLPGVPTTWELGAFTVGGVCNQLNPANAAAGNPDPCAPPIPIPTLGTIRYMGTSLPGGTPW